MLYRLGWTCRRLQIKQKTLKSNMFQYIILHNLNGLFWPLSLLQYAVTNIIYHTKSSKRNQTLRKALHREPKVLKHIGHSVMNYNKYRCCIRWTVPTYFINEGNLDKNINTKQTNTELPLIHLYRGWSRTLQREN